MVRIGGMRADERAGEISVDHRVPLGDAQYVRRLADVGAGIVDENVEAAVTRRSCIDQRAAGGLAGHVDFRELGFASGLRDALHGGFALFGIAPGEHHDGTGRRETLRHAEPDAAIAPGDDRDAAGKIEKTHWLSQLRLPFQRRCFCLG